MTSTVVFLIIVAYLVGSISSAILITKLFANSDIRQQGSGNPGATNVLRVAGKRAAVLVFLFDAAKGTIPVYAGFLLGLPPIALSLIAISACVGHIYPVFFQFKGGKGVATAIGAILPLDWWLMLCLLSTWLLIFIVLRISSLAAIVTLVLAPVYTYIFKPEYTVAVALLCLIIIGKHKDNIKRLIQNKEHTIRRH
ncbi:MAG: glycerol-3-phosphate 1-O-acyltransferase PlsY [Glaciecola sp.]